nr:CCE016g [Helicoverpa armigera]
MKLVSCLGVLVLCAIQTISCDDATLVQVQQGQLTGEILTSVLGETYYSYKGIPYAKPPVNELRFRDPQDPEPWDGVLAATAHGSVCPQFNPLSAIYTSGSEDCLFLNVYTPSLNPDKPLPVVVFIHGGAYIFGSGNSGDYGPDYLVKQRVVTVTINYRLGALGFLSLGDANVPGNAALKDQVMALKWVQKNIRQFGGDPNSVTIYGDTAGGASVTLHMLSPMSKGLFHKAIAMSGSPTCDYGITYKPEEKAKIFGKLLGAPDTENTTALLEFLQSADYDTFYPIAPTVLASEEITDVLFKMEHFTPVIEKNTGNNFLTEDYFNLLRSGKVNKEVDFMIGYSSKEAILLIDVYNASYISQYDRYRELFTPSEILIKSTPDTNLQVANAVKNFYFGDNTVSTDNLDLFVSYSSNASIGYHAQRFANKWANIGKKTYFFKFNFFTEWNVFGQQGVKYGLQEASHFDMPFYVFYPNDQNWTVDTSSQQYALVQKITTAIANFAKNSDPSTDTITWPAYTSSEKAYVTFENDDVTVGYGPDDQDYIFWKDTYEKAGVNF